MSERPVIKSTMFGGFERQSVLNYIYETVSSSQEAQERLTAQIEEMSANREQLEEAVRELELRLAESENNRSALGEELHLVRAKNSEFSGMLEKLSAEIERQKVVVQEKDEQIKIISQAKANLERENADLHMQASQLQSGRDGLEQTKLRIGELVIKSHMDAEGIMSKTNIQAQQVLEQANFKAKRMLEQAEARVRLAEEEAAKSARDFYGQIGRFRSDMSGLEGKLEQVVVSMREAFDAMNAVINKSDPNTRSTSRPGHIVLVSPPADGTAAELPEEFF